MVDLTLQDHIRALLDEIAGREHFFFCVPADRRELARLIAAHVQEVFIDAPEAVAADAVPVKRDAQSAMRHALAYMVRSMPAPNLFDAEFRTVVDNLKAALGMPI